MMQVSIKPQDGESLDGFLRRLAETDFWADVADYLGQAGASYGHRMIEDLATVEKNLNVEQGLLAAISPQWKSENPIYNWRYERLHSAPVCPACISEGRPHRQAWRHVFVTACTQHDLLLVDQCPICWDPLVPGKGGYSSCACGGSLFHLERSKATETELAVSALVGGEMHPSRASLPPALAFRTPGDIGDFIFFLAASGAATRSGKHGKTTIPKTIEEARRFLATATALICDWPAAFRKDASARLQRGDRCASTAPERLGRWYQRLMRFSHPAYADFRSELAKVVSEEFDGAYVGAIDLSPELEREWVSAAEAARMIGIRSDRIVDAVANKEIDGKLYSRGFGHRHTVIHRTTVDIIRANRCRFGDLKTLRYLLGVSRKQYDLLREAGLMETVVAMDLPPLVAGSHDLEAARALVNQVAEGAIAIESETIALRDINLRFTTDRAGVLAVLRAIRDGKLRPALPSSSGNLAAFEFDRAAVEAVLHETLRGPGFTVQEIGRMTGWKDQCIAHWCDLGLLGHETFQHAGRVGRVIRSEDLIRFQAEYVPAATLAKQTKTTARSVMARLKEARVEPIGAFRDGPAWRGHLVRLADLTTAGWSVSASHDRD